MAPKRVCTTLRPSTRFACREAVAVSNNETRYTSSTALSVTTTESADEYVGCLL
jgi:hypothetical protein